MLEQYNDLLSVDDLAKIFNVSKATIYKEIKSGIFGRCIQIGREFRFSKVYIIDKLFLCNDIAP